MKYEYYAELAEQSACPAPRPLPAGLVAGFVDGCTAWSTRGNEQKNEARRRYIQSVKEHVDKAQNQSFPALALPPGLNLEPEFENLSSTQWIALKIDFVLLTPWYSKDDRVFHVLDNPVRKDWVFGVPFMAASSWKGMLRWAFRMVTGLAGSQRDSGEDEQKKARIMEVYLFGHEKGETDLEKFREGALVFYPTWFDRIGFEVINPHSRKRRAGTQPIYYEVVPGRRAKKGNPNQYEEGGKGTLSILYAPLPGAAKRDGVTAAETIEKLLEAIEKLLTLYGISAKRTVGWGTAKIEQWNAYRKDCQPVKKPNRSEFWDELRTWFSPEVEP